jgi:hypothetical protein
VQQGEMEVMVVVVVVVVGERLEVGDETSEGQHR